MSWMPTLLFSSGSYDRGFLSGPGRGVFFSSSRSRGGLGLFWVAGEPGVVRWRAAAVFFPGFLLWAGGEDFL